MDSCRYSKCCVDYTMMSANCNSGADASRGFCGDFRRLSSLSFLERFKLRRQLKAEARALETRTNYEIGAGIQQH